MSEKQGKNSKSLFQKLTDMLNPQPGLTKEEKKRYAEAKHTLEGSGKVKEVPDTAQKTITFRKMYRDGICQVTPTYYTKMVEFYDINYDLLEIDDQGDILEEYSKLINYFDPSIKFELFLFNRQVNEQTLVEQFDIPLQEDGFNDIREEYTAMLKKQAAKGNNGIIKSKYIIFGVESKGFKEARSKLASIEADVIKNFINIGTHAKSLDGKERLRVLHEYFNQDTMEPFRFSFKELAESGKSVKDYIAPPGFDFRYPIKCQAFTGLLIDGFGWIFREFIYSIFIYVCIGQNTFKNSSSNNTFYFIIYSIIFKWIIYSIRDIRTITRSIVADTYGDKNIQFISVWRQSGRRCSYNYDCIYSFVFIAITGFV